VTMPLIQIAIRGDGDQEPKVLESFDPETYMVQFVLSNGDKVLVVHTLDDIVFRRIKEGE